MRVTGYRMINISCRSTGYDVVTDSYVRGIDEACVILDMIVRSILSSGRIAVAIETDGTTGFLEDTDIPRQTEEVCPPDLST